MPFFKKLTLLNFFLQKIHPKYTKIHHTNLQYNLLDRPISYIQSFYKCAPPSLPPLLLLQMLSHVCSIFRNFLVLAINPIMIAPIRRPADYQIIALLGTRQLPHFSVEHRRTAEHILPWDEISRQSATLSLPPHWQARTIKPKKKQGTLT